MKSVLQDSTHGSVTAADGRVDIVTRAELAHCRHWIDAFARERKDHRYYELVEDTIKQDFDYRYFVIRDADDDICAIQPFFIHDQDLLGGIGGPVTAIAASVRRWWPAFMRLRTLMVGCAAGEGHLDRADEQARCHDMERLACAIAQHARVLNARLIVLKEFPAQYRTSLGGFLRRGFTRVPSLPMVNLNLDYADFEDYMKRGISGRTRAHLRRKFRDAAQAAPIEMNVVTDITPIIDEVYPLYLQVYERSKLRFERLTKEYLCQVGRFMPDKARFFVWRQSGRIIAFSLLMVQDDAIYSEYIGLDYSVALQLHMYFYAVRDIVTWAIANGYKRFLSTSLSYEPKWHLRFDLHPLDLYVRHTSRVMNFGLKWLLPLLEPTRYDKTLRRFSNYDELWESRREAGRRKA